MRVSPVKKSRRTPRKNTPQRRALVPLVVEAATGLEALAARVGLPRVAAGCASVAKHGTRINGAALAAREALTVFLENEAADGDV